jgi:hypothetical protein
VVQKRRLPHKGDPAFQHVSVLGFIALDGSSQGPGVICSGKMVNTNWPVIWPGASFAVGPEGSCTTQIFAKFLKEAWLDHLSPEQLQSPKVLILDSGGGALLHLSPRIYKLFKEFQVWPYYLASYCTKALMPLDQVVHSECQRLWTKFRLKWGKKARRLNLLRALYAIHKVSKDAYTATHVISSWRHCGFAAGRAIDADKLLNDKAMVRSKARRLLS